MMNHKTTRTWTVVLVAVLALSLLLAACGNGSDTPTGDNSTPGVTDTQTPSGAETPDNTQGATSPGETPDESNPPDAPTPEVNKAAEYEAGGYYEEMKASIDEKLADLQNGLKIILGIDFNVENTLDDIEQKYGEYLSINITRDAIKIAIVKGGGTYFEKDYGNLTGISPDALKDVNDFLAGKGETPLDSKNPEQNVAALWLAASLYYDPNVDNGDPAYDIALPFGLAWADSSPGNLEVMTEKFWNAYITLFNLREY